MSGLIKLFSDNLLSLELSNGSWASTIVLPTVVLPISGDVLSSDVPGYGMNLGTTTMQNIILQSYAGVGVHGTDFAANLQIAPDVFGTPGSHGSDGAAVVVFSGNLLPSKAAPGFNTTSPVVVNPTSPPALSETVSAGTNLAAGTYTVGYTCTNSLGETLMSPVSTISIAAGSSIHVGAISLLTNSTGINYYMCLVPGLTDLYLAGSNSGAAAIDLVYPNGFFRFWMRQDVNSGDPTGVYQGQIQLTATDIG